MTSDTGLPSGEKFRSSKLSSSMARSTMGFLLGFLTLPISEVRAWGRRIGSVASVQKPGAGSTRTAALPSCKDHSWERKTMTALRRFSCFSLLTRVVKVNEETVSLSTRINCRWRRATSAANEMPMD